MVRAALLSATMLAACPAAAQAPLANGQPQQDTIDSVVTQLPRTAVPRHYAIEVTPDAPNLRFSGRVAIDVDVVKPTDRLVLNAKELTFDSVSIRAGSGAPKPGTATIDPKAQTVTLAFGSQLAPGRYRLDIAYRGVIHQQANGFFALDSKAPDGSPRRSLFTQFEAADARAFVPSWDEPDYKARWDLSVVAPANLMAVGNMPAARTEPLPGNLKRVTFRQTPLMSSYLLFLGVGDFGRIKTMSGNTEVAITMGRGNEAKAQTALDAEAQVLTYYNQYFGTPYPLPKLENVAGPGQSQFFGAMENWGAIFTFERILLDDPAITTDAERQAIFGVQAHEMAHQWFGDLVTMAWWDDLWLNEGFASWMANKTTQHFHPDWGADVEHVASREEALDIDAFATTHPIVQSVRTVEQANQAFDTITYSKGESVLTMLEGFAGPDVWQKGIQAYIAAHKYRNTRTDDLWHAVEQAGAAGITQIAHDFTLQPGVPLIRVGAASCAGGSTTVSVTQGQFSEDKPDAAPLRWHVPVRAMTLGGAPMRAIVANGSGELKVAGCAPLLINAGQTGYYRTLYQPDQIAQLTKAYASLAPVDQYGLLADNLALASANYQPMAVGLDLLAAVPADAQPKVTELAVQEWSALYQLFDGDAATQARIAADMSARFGPVLQRLGMAPRAGEPVLEATLRPVLIRALGRVGDQTVTAEARRLFQDPASIPGSLKSAWLRVVAENADAATWDRLHALAKGASGAVERSTFYDLLGRTRDPALAQRALDLSLTDEPGPTISSDMIGAVANRHSELALDFVLAHLDRVRQLTDTSGWSRFIARLGESSHQPTTIDKLDAYATAHVAATDRKPIDQTIAHLRTRFARQARLQEQTRAWLAAHAS
ncbi:M1 family metallopeptidase [Sphingomonas changbaiensis]|nr:M1 family metallopeptidase [Sphingomonas changbaiensis]